MLYNLAYIICCVINQLLTVLFRPGDVSKVVDIYRVVACFHDEHCSYSSGDGKGPNKSV